MLFNLQRRAVPSETRCVDMQIERPESTVVGALDQRPARILTSTKKSSPVVQLLISAEVAWVPRPDPQKSAVLSTSRGILGKDESWPLGEELLT